MPILGNASSGGKGSVPATPVVGTATVTNSTTVSLTFTAPFSKLPITSYTVTSSPSISLSTLGTSSPLTVTGTFASNQAYTFAIAAVNANGTSTASSASNSVTPVPGPTITTATAMPAARAFGSTPSNAYHSGRYWYVGGATVTNPDTNANNNVYSFDGTSWTTEANYPFSYNSPSAVSDGTNLYVIGGSPVSNGSTEVRYISGTGGSWSTGTSLPAPAHRQACVYYSGKIHALSGDNNSGSGTLRHYRLDSGSWTTLSDTPGTAGLIPSAAVYNSKIYRYSYDTFYSYNGTSWTAEPAPPATNRYSVALLAIGSKIYAIGGNTGLWANTAVNTIYSFNGTAWTTESVTLPVEKGWHSAGTDGTVGYVYGGINNSSSVVATNYKITP